MNLLDPRGISVEPRTVDAPLATFSIDVESDYGCGRTEALSQIERFLDVMAELEVPVTAFVEGQFFASKRPLCRRLIERGVDVQLHCFDHGQPGDTPETLRRGAAAYAELCGHRPRGYRAHTYRLTGALFDTLLEEGFCWDSSLMRAHAQGRNKSAAFARGDYFLLAGRIVEFPLGRWNGVPVPLNHAYRLLAKAPLEAVLRACFGPERLVAYNVHMTDLVRSDSLRFAKRSRASRLLHRYMWSTHGGDTFASLRSIVRWLRRRGFAFHTTDDLYRQVG